MWPLGTTNRRPLSTAAVGTAILAACGWHTGPPPGGGTALVSGASVEPGARLALARGAAGSNATVELLGVDVVPQAAGPTGTAAWTSRVRARVGTPERPGCGGEISAERVFVATDPDTAWSVRSDAVAAAAEEVGRRAAAAARGASCRP